ncbi:RagB/SusD family nutrient uptake outer membrane protein [Flavobacterium sp. CLA17]|uniref:RagB/SusD family nutrient uptake outer membrane protein n=1 Tax=Flavobacterium sp. CLA17 TaxID=2724135 RepID=UPI001491C094|nr:RagB/SusD family nutrient uptake outer membrane protein [Flavobacterium sp. CLA17]QSB26423.1 RagB/SusD family nutrient uptake outer membrane protein [Flavobacterium sp. CLA17]
MKTLISKFFIAITALFILVGCSDEFLDEPKPTNTVSADIAFGSREGTEALISGIMRRFRGQYTSTDAAGLNSMFFARSVKGNDLIETDNWFGFDYANDNREPTYRRTTFTWNYCFYMINQANTLINGVNASTALSEGDKKELAAYGHALRGFFYHQLVMEFAPTYSADINFPAPPIYTETSSTGNPMSTVGEVYKLIVDDLTIAVDGLTEDRLGKSYINKNVANGILAQVYQVMGNWEGAKNAAIACYGGDPEAVLDAESYRSGFDDIDNVEWIWGSAQTPDQSNYYWNAPAVFIDHKGPYDATYVNRDFVALFSATDVRAYFARKSASITDMNDHRYWITNKFTFSFEGDNVIIRSPEMILIEAEAKARLGDNGGAKTLLYTLQLNRDVNAIESTNTGAALIEEILVERRKELYAECGVEWFDAKRLRRGITRTGNHRIGAAGSLTADDKKFFLKIPQAEIDANPFIEDAVNANR